MNLRYRSLCTAYIARPAPIADALGGMQETYAAPHATAQGHFLPDGGALKKGADGLHVPQTLRLLLPPRTDILPGDGVGKNEASVRYRVTRCDKYPLHLCAHLEAIGQ